MTFSPTGGFNLGDIFVYHNRLGVKVFPSLFHQIVSDASEIYFIMRHLPIGAASLLMSRSTAGRRTDVFCGMVPYRGPFGCRQPTFCRRTPSRWKRVCSAIKLFFSSHKVEIMPSLPATLKLPWPRGTLPVTLPHQVYLVGGSVRDLLLGRRPLDLDLAVAGNPRAFAQRLAARTGGRLVPLGKPGLMLYRLVHGSQVIDVSAISGRSISEDLQRRDFTINAMAIDVASGDIIDICNGRADLAAGRVRMVSRSAFGQDPVRLIRTFRMAAVLGFEVTPATAAAVSDQAMLITRPAGERICAELLKILETGRAADAISQMVDCGLLSAMLPELAALRSARPDQKPRCDRFEHTLKAFFELETLLADPQTVIPSDIDPMVWSPTSIPAAILKLAILLHELVRPSANRKDWRRFRSPPVDCDAVKTICARYKMSNRKTHYVDFIVRRNRWPLLLFEAHRRKRLSDRAVSRFFMMGGDKTPDLFIHAAADAAGGTCEIGHQEQTFAGFARGLLRRYFTDFLPRKNSPPLLTGRDLIELTGLQPAPIFKFLLTRIEADRLAGRLQTKDEAIRRVKKMLQRRPPPQG
jgi:tRNA nucleotidyltransferase/poly(A) polymerase